MGTRGTAPARTPMMAALARIGCATLVALLSCGCHGDAGPPSSFRELAQRFERAHRDRDLDALRSLVCWDGATPAIQDTFDQQARRDFGRDIGSVFAEEIGVDGARVNTADHTHPCVGLRTIGTLHITFVPRNEEGKRAAPAEIRYLYGRKDGAYVLAPPVTPPAE